MTITRTPYCTKIRYGIVGAPTLDADEMDGSFSPGIGVAPTLIEFIYGDARDGKPASVSASVTGEWMRFGKSDGGQVTTHFKNGPDGWPVWLAEEARRHDPVDRSAEEAYRLALSTALRLGTGANWEAIRDRAEDLAAEVGQWPETVPCMRSEAHPPHLHSGLRKGVAVHGKCPGGAEALMQQADEAQRQTETESEQVSLARSGLAVLLAHHADVVAASLYADGRSGLPELRAGMERAAELLTLHANALTGDEETPAVSELLDSILTFRSDPAPASFRAAVEEPATETLRCVCGDPVEWMDVDVAYGSGWIHQPGSDTPCLNARPRCPHCGLPHDLDPASGAPAACASILASIRERDEEPELVADPQPVSDEFMQHLASVKVREDATVDPAMCPRCKGDNREAFALCPSCAEADGRLLCPRCRTDITDYAEGDHVFRTGDERPYCSGECVIAAHRGAASQPGKEA